MQQSSQSNLVPTGISGLDEILLGGVTRYNNILVEGPPGAGKTTFGLGFIHAGATRFDEPGLIVSMEIDQEKLLRDATGFEWDLEALIAADKVKIIQTSPGVLLNELRSDDSVLRNELESIGARRLLIDGLTPLRLYAEAHDMPFREDIHLLVDGLARLGVTTLMTAERDTSAHQELAHERYVFDTIIELSSYEQRRGLHRRISVVKSRGQDFIGGTHAMRIEAGLGIDVYRRAQAQPKNAENQPTSSRRITTGCEELDRMMDGGVYEGSITLVTGISGTGKTVAGTQFLRANALQGRAGLLVTLDEHPRQLIRNANTLGFDLEPLVENGSLRILYESPLELDLDIHFKNVADIVEQHDVACVVLDSVAVYEMTDPDGVADFLYALANFLKERLVTVYFNYESPELLGVSQISEELKGSHLADNIILLNYVEVSTRLRRALTVPKVRGSKNQQLTREIRIGKGGLNVVDEASDAQGEGAVPQLPFSAYYGLLARSPTRRSPLIDEAVAQGEELPPSDPPGGEL